MTKIQGTSRRKRERLIATVAAVPFGVAFSLLFSAGAVFGEILLCRIGCALIAVSLARHFYGHIRSEWSSDAQQRIEFGRGYALRSGIPMALGALLTALGWVLAEPSRGFEAAVAAFFGIGLQVAVWAGRPRRIADPTGLRS